MPLLCWLLVVSGRQANLSTALLVNMALVIVVAAIGGLLPGLVASFLSVGLTNWFLTPPLHTLHINDRDDIVALIIFVATTVIVSALVDRAARRAREAGRARAEARALARTSGAIVSAADPLPELLEQLRALFDVNTAMILDHTDAGWTIASSAGEAAAADPALGPSRPLDPDGEQLLVLVGGELTPDDHAVLDAFTQQLALGLEARRLRQDAAAIDALAETNELRTALLRAVSHDLRTPLASIKASVSGLLRAGRGVLRLGPGGAAGQHRRRGRPTRPGDREPPRHEPPAGRGDPDRAPPDGAGRRRRRGPRPPRGGGW